MKITRLAATMVICAFAFGLIATSAGPAQAAEAAAVQAHEHELPAIPPEAFGKIQALDPVTGAPAELEYFAEYEGRVIHFSSAESADEFTSAPETYMPAVLLQTEWIQRTDPVSGKTARLQFFADYMGRRVHFSSADSVETFTKEPVKYLEKANAQLVPAQKLDPVDSKPITAKYFADYMGRRIYFSSAASVDKFIGDHRKYVDILDRQLEKRRDELTSPPDAEGGESAEIAQKTCPVMGAPINPDLYVDYEGARIYFCCASCVEVFRKDPEKYIEKVDAEIAEEKKKAEGGE